MTQVVISWGIDLAIEIFRISILRRSKQTCLDSWCFLGLFFLGEHTQSGNIIVPLLLEQIPRLAEVTVDWRREEYVAYFQLCRGEKVAVHKPVQSEQGLLQIVSIRVN